MSLQQKPREINFKVQFPEKFQPAFLPMRYKIFHGGRGGGKSWNIARALLVLAAKEKMRILCAREFQNSISDSVHKLLSDQIVDLGLEPIYEIQNATIICQNGSEFIFTGLRHNAGKLKSFENIKIVWVEEAQNVSRTSWEILIPTIRAEESEIWISFNPELESDETYQRFIKNTPPSAAVIQMNYYDNPWFPAVLQQEMETLKSRDPDAYMNIWEGYCKQALEGAVYAKELRNAQSDGRITKVPYLQQFPVSVFCDLGWADNTSLWFVQKVGFEYHLIRAYQNRHEAWQHYLQYMQSLGYIYDTIYLPHDARAKSLGTGKSIEEISRAAGYKTIVVPNLSIEDGINAVRTVFPVMYFDEENCSDGIQALRRYRYDVDNDTKEYSRKPLHDENSHFADAIRYFAVGLNEKGPKYLPKLPPKTIELSLKHKGNYNRANWMK